MDLFFNRMQFTFRGTRQIILFSMIGMFSFLLIYGPRTLDVTYTDWLMQGKDPTQHFLGWEFFRNDAWGFPIGKITSFGYPIGTSTSGTDSITLLAVIFKILNPVLPVEFQYFGIWAFFCFAMQGILGGLLLSLFVRDQGSGEAKIRYLAIIVLGTIFFCISPILVKPSHSALCGQWIILLSLYLFFKAGDTNVSIASWIVVQVLSILIMPYFTFMTLVIFIGSEIHHALAFGRLNKENPFSGILRFCAVFFATGFCCWMIGLLNMGTMGTSVDQYGYYSMNLNALFNPMGWSSSIPSLSTASDGQTAGFNFLGLGMIWILIASSGLLIFSRLRNTQTLFYMEKIGRWSGLFFIIAFLSVFSITNKITLFDHVLLVIPLPEYILELCAIFRSSGRMFWPVYYLLYLLAFRGFSKIATEWKTGLYSIIFIASMLIVQIADMANSPLLKEKLALRSDPVTYRNPLQSVFWNDAARLYRHIVFLPARIEDYDTFSFYAVKNKMTINTGYFARQPSDQITRYAKQREEDLRKGIIETDTLYIIKDPILQVELTAIFRDKPLGHLYTVDNFIVLVPYAYPGLAAVPFVNQRFYCENRHSGIAPFYFVHASAVNIFMASRIRMSGL